MSGKVVLIIIGCILMSFLPYKLPNDLQTPNDECVGCSAIIKPREGEVGKVSLPLIGDLVVFLSEGVSVVIDAAAAIGDAFEFISTATVVKWIVTTTPGKCTAGNPTPKPGESLQCTGDNCKLSLAAQIRANDYARPPFWDSYEEILCIKSGVETKLSRSLLETKTFTSADDSPCDPEQEDRVAIKLDNNGILLQPWSCGACVETL